MKMPTLNKSTVMGVGAMVIGIGVVWWGFKKVF